MGDDEYFCISHYRDIGPRTVVWGGSVQLSHIAYYVIGSTAAKAETVKIVANQNMPDTASAKACRDEMLLATQAWFKATALALPNGLAEAISTGKPYSGRLPNASIQYEVERLNRTIKASLVITAPK